MWVHYPIIGVPYPVCWPALVAMLAMLELEVVLQLELDQDHVAAPPSGHQPGPTHRDAPLLLCLPAAPGCSGKCCVQAGLPLHAQCPSAFPCGHMGCGFQKHPKVQEERKKCWQMSHAVFLWQSIHKLQIRRTKISNMRYRKDKVVVRLTNLITRVKVRQWAVHMQLNTTWVPVLSMNLQMQNWGS